MKWLLVIVSASIFILSDAISADWGKNNNIFSLFLIFLFPPLGYISFAYLNKIENLSVSSALVNLILLTGAILIGVFYFKDSLSIKQIFGLMFAIVAFILLED